MVNNLNEKRNNIVLIAALISAFVFAMCALITGLVLGISKKYRDKEEYKIARFLLVDAASDLNHTVSAMRLCTEKDPAQNLCNTGLVFAVRAETALECGNGDWNENSKKEAFLNDMAEILHAVDPMKAVEKADVMFKYSTMFYEHVKDGKAFEYNGELATANGEQNPNETDKNEPSDSDVEAAKKLVKNALNTDSERHIGSYAGKIEFDLERGGKPGYAVTEGERIVEFSFAHSGGDGDAIDEKTAANAALDCASRCGFDSLNVCAVDVKHDFALVRLCKNIDGALACDEYASVAVVGGEAVAFSAGHCDCDHTVPKAKFTEQQARRAAPKGYRGEGMLVTRKVDGRERICYEYRYDLEDGVHFVYVCAENGKQMQIK